MIKLTTARSLRVRYLIGLSAIALLVTTSFVTMQHVVSKQRNFAQIVNLAGQQRGLVNRLAYFASQMATTDNQADFDQARAQVGRTINRIEDNHRLLREGSPEAGIPKVTSPTLTMIYEDPMVGVDKALASFIERVRQVYATEMEALELTESSLFHDMDHALEILGPLRRQGIGIETDEQRAFLASEGCDLLQGYLLARPMPFDDLDSLIEQAASQQPQDPTSEPAHQLRQSRA